MTTAAEAAKPRSADRRRAWIVVFTVAVGLVMCGCASTVFLVLTGIIAEPVTVIEEILRVVRALVGG
ncbi:MAG: hypothetical protein JXP37_09910 [Coriobacteriia bacterium]|nr:hypothetical protein [Coriobacteriia bacterium]